MKPKRMFFKRDRLGSGEHPTVKLKINNTKWEERTKDYDKTFLLFVTGECNLQCSFCFNSSNLGQNKEMNLDYIKQIVKANPKVNKYDIQGGEPLLHSNINEIIRYLNSVNKKVGIYTNGYFLDRLDVDHKNLKICISFQSLVSDDKSFKPITDIEHQIQKYQSIYPMKLIFLINRFNGGILNDFVGFVESKFQSINKITIGAVRDESDYWNDDVSYVLPFSEYATIVQDFIDNYEGRLNVDVFSKGILRSPKLPKAQCNQICRFKNIFSNNTYVPCLYLIARDKKIAIDDNFSVPFYRYYKCARTGRQNCLADKIYLINKKHAQGRNR